MQWQGSAMTPAAQQPVAVRNEYLRRVYGRLAVGLAGFVTLLWFMFSSGAAVPLTVAMLGGSWLLVLGGFMVVSWLANRLAWSQTSSTAAQWGGFALLVVANAVIFTPLIVTAELAAPGVVVTAGWYTAAGVAALSFAATRSQRDYSWLGPLLAWAGLAALAAIVTAVLFGFNLGAWFSLAMITVAGAAILHDTQQVVARGVPGGETRDAMLLFSSVTLMLWYVIRLLAASRR
jgi:uncharacterized protein